MNRKLKMSIWAQTACTSNWLLSKDTQSTEIWMKSTKTASNMCCGFVLRAIFFQRFSYFPYDFALTSTIIQSSFQFFRAQFDLRLSMETLYQWLWMNKHACMQCLSCAFMCMASYTIVWLSRKYQCRIVFAYRLFNACSNTTYENRNALVMNCCNGETSEVVAVIMNVSTSFTATILIYRQGSSARLKYCQPGKFRIAVHKQRTVRNRWVYVRKIFFNDAKNFYAFRLFLPLFFRFAPFSCILVLADIILL